MPIAKQDTFLHLLYNGNNGFANTKPRPAGIFLVRIDSNAAAFYNKHIP